ncbi:Translation initiation factor eIF-5 [uncultured virus]|nr:Translation initiation factor eIF-5 [uncultured virus]
MENSKQATEPMVGTKDPAFRYRMPVLVTKKETDVTVLVNIDAIAKAVHRPVKALMKYLSSVLGTGVAHKKKRYLVRGHHETDALRQHLRNFNAKYVRCGNCKNTFDTYVKVAKSGGVKTVCTACGAIARSTDPLAVAQVE